MTFMPIGRPLMPRANADAQVNAGVCLNATTDDLVDTLPACQRAVTLAVENEDDGVINSICWSKGKENLAVRMQSTCQLAIDRAVKDRVGIFSRSICVQGIRNGFTKAVLRVCDRVIELQPEHGMSHLSRGIARGQTRDYPGASQDLNSSLHWLKDQPPGLLNFSANPLPTSR